MIGEPHLVISETALKPGAEWNPPLGRWCFGRVQDGHVYHLQQTQGLDVQMGDMFVLAPEHTGNLRASQLNGAKIAFFSFDPDQLSGVLTLVERKQLESGAAMFKSAWLHFPANTPPAQEFTALCKDKWQENGYRMRCGLLRLSALVFDAFMKHPAPSMPNNASAEQRFEQIIQQIPENELINHTPTDLARMCGCSFRHFSRLFHRYFGISVRSKQTSLRLTKAQQLLRETDAKIIHVAMDSGYRHLGLFNALFKKHLGMTPSQWRKKQSLKSCKRTRKNPCQRAILMPALAIVWLVLLLTPGMQGANRSLETPPVSPTAPNTSGRPLQETTEQRIQRIEKELEAFEKTRMKTNTAATATSVAATTKAGPLFDIRGYEIQGNTLLPEKSIHRVLEQYTGKGMNFEDIRTGLSKLQMVYRMLGLVTVNVSLPRQQLTNGLVKVAITEGWLVEVNIVSNRFFSTENILRTLPSLRTNEVLNNLVFQQELDRANQNRDRQIYPIIGPGPEPGTSSLKLRVQDRLPLHGRFDLNNQSTPGTPSLRAGASVMYNNLWQQEHQAGVQYSFTPQQFREEKVSPNIWDKPAVASYSAFYRLPLNLSGQQRASQNISIADFGYDEATRRFRPPSYGENLELMFFASRSSSDLGLKTLQDSFNPTSDSVIQAGGGLSLETKLQNQTQTINEGVGMRIQRSFRLDDKTSLSISAGPDFKRYNSYNLQRQNYQAVLWVPNKANPVTQFDYDQFPSAPSSTDRNLTSEIHYMPLTLSFDLNRADETGTTSVNVNNIFNISGLFNDSQDFQMIANNPKSSGTYYVVNASVTREQKLTTDFWLRLRAEGQYATEPLISNEQYAMGGMNAPRGYLEGQAYMDQGYKLTLEPHTRAFNLGMVDGTLPLTMKFSLFCDYARGYFVSAPLEVPGNISLASTGLGMSATVGERWDMRLQAGWAILDGANRQAGTTRVTFSLSMQF